MNAHSSNPKDLISVFDFFATLKKAFDTNNIHEGTVVWILPNYVKGTLANALSSRICAEDRLSIIDASVRDLKLRSPKLLSSDSELDNYLLKKYGTAKVVAKNDG